jgi:hypothetical protein
MQVEKDDPRGKEYLVLGTRWSDNRLLELLDVSLAMDAI